MSEWLHALTLTVDAYFFLFNDLLLFTRVNYNKKYAVHARIVLDLAHCTVFDLTDGGMSVLCSQKSSLIRDSTHSLMFNNSVTH